MNQRVSLILVIFLLLPAATVSAQQNEPICEKRSVTERVYMNAVELTDFLDGEHSSLASTLGGLPFTAERQRPREIVDLARSLRNTRISGDFELVVKCYQNSDRDLEVTLFQHPLVLPKVEDVSGDEGGERFDGETSKTIEGVRQEEVALQSMINLASSKVIIPENHDQQAYVDRARVKIMVEYNKSAPKVFEAVITARAEFCYEYEVVSRNP